MLACKFKSLIRNSKFPKNKTKTKESKEEKEEEEKEPNGERISCIAANLYETRNDIA